MPTKTAPTEKTKTDSAKEKTGYSTSRKLQELEDRIATCEGVLETNFSETMGQLIDQRTKAIEQIQKQRSVDATDVLFYVGVSVLIILTVVRIVARPSIRYMRE